MSKELLFCTMDFETTMLLKEPGDLKKLEIIEFGWVLHTHKKILGLHNYLIKPSDRISEEIERLTKISNDDLDNFGVSHMFAFTTFISDIYLSQCPRPDYFIAHNGKVFDEKIFRKYIEIYFEACGDLTQQDLKKPILETPWIDSMTDIPYPPEITVRKLTYLALEHNYMTTNAHRAVFDCLAAVHLVKQYPIADILQQRNDPEIIVSAAVAAPWVDSGKSKEWAGLAGFKGKKLENGTYTYTKRIRRSKLDDLCDNAPVTISEEAAL